MEEQLKNIADYLKAIADAQSSWKLLLPSLVGILGVIVGFFLGPMWKWWWRPRLTVRIDQHRAMTTTKTKAGIHTRYYRITVANIGRAAAENCVAFLWRVERCDCGEWEALEYHDTLPLNWSYCGDEVARNGLTLPPRVPHDVDVVEAREGEEGRVILKTKPEANRYSDLLDQPGRYRFSIYIIAPGVRKVEAILELKIFADSSRAPEVRFPATVE